LYNHCGNSMHVLGWPQPGKKGKEVGTPSGRARRGRVRFNISTFTGKNPPRHVPPQEKRAALAPETGYGKKKSRPPDKIIVFGPRSEQKVGLKKKKRNGTPGRKKNSERRSNKKNVRREKEEMKTGVCRPITDKSTTQRGGKKKTRPSAEQGKHE